MKYTYLLVVLASVTFLTGCLNQEPVGSPVGPKLSGSFSDCVAKGNPVMESYPRQCRYQGITYTEEINDLVPTEDLIGQNCDSAQDCPLPGSYAVRSDCPYSTACRQGRCVIICPLRQYGPAINSGANHQTACQAASDCDCSLWTGGGDYRCACFDGQCAAVIVE